MSGADVLDRAADYLEEHGWTQRTFGYEECGPRCAVGAMRDTDEPGLALLDALHALTDTVAPYGDVYEWNDAHGQTAADVIATMRACATSLRSAQ